MSYNNLDLIVFGVFLATIVAVGFAAARRGRASDDYFLAGRNLTWWLIGGSMIAANISTHHFIGMGGLAFHVGLAVASYEWMAAIVLILYAKFFLPYYLKTRITTMPEFLERRFDHRVRLVYAVICLIGYVVIELAVVLYTGALAVHSIFGLRLEFGLMIFGLAGAYAIYGGFRSVARTDIVQVTVLILGGLVVTVLGLSEIGRLAPEFGATAWGGFRNILAGAPEKFHMVRPWNDPDLPWVGVFFGGLWFANIFYWGCNQFITQGSLSARNVWHGQMGAVFAGFLKLLVPVLVVLPGIIAFRLYNAEDGLLRETFILDKGDLAFPSLVKHLLPSGFTGLVMAGLVGCVMSHIASMLTATSTILTFDIYEPILRRRGRSTNLVRVGRLMTAAVLVIAVVVGFFLRDLKGIFEYIQKYWSIAYPSVCALFLAGFFYPRANARGSLIAIVAGPLWAIAITAAEGLGWVPVIPFLNRAVIDFAFAMLILWLFRTRDATVPASAHVDRSHSPEMQAILRSVPWWRSFGLWAGILVACVIGLYLRFF
ncbi:MAG: sodium/solute symporter [Opitutaceae bacterium]|nr:sodium/solute symporter [Opitutaceae bacterium]